MRYVSVITKSIFLMYTLYVGNKTIYLMNKK